MGSAGAGRGAAGAGAGAGADGVAPPPDTISTDLCAATIAATNHCLTWAGAQGGVRERGGERGGRGGTGPQRT